MKMKKAKIVAALVLAGLTGCFAAEIPAPHTAEALVLVKDPDNIAEAIKTATNTANMLTNLTKQLELQIKGMEKLTPGDINYVLTTVQNQNKKREDFAWGTGQDQLNPVQIGGILSNQTSVLAQWNDTLGNVEDILNGKITTGIFGVSKQGTKLLDQTAKDTAEAAKQSQINDHELSQMVQQSLEMSSKAEGEMQALQAGNAINAAMAQSIMNGNQTLANLAAMQAVNNQRDNIERVTQYQRLEDTENEYEQWLNSRNGQR